MSQTNGDNPRSKGILQNASNGNMALMLGGAALAIYGITRRSKTGMAMAAAGSILAITKTYNQAQPAQYTAKATFTIETSPETAYQFWKNFENLPRFMRHLKSVRVTGPRESEWVALGPLEQEFQWRAETTEDTENRRIAWRSLPGSQIPNSGSVEFTPSKDGRGNVGHRGTDVSTACRSHREGGSYSAWQRPGVHRSRRCAAFQVFDRDRRGADHSWPAAWSSWIAWHCGAGSLPGGAKPSHPADAGTRTPDRLTRNVLTPTTSRSYL